MGSLNQVKKQLVNAQEQSNVWQNKAKSCLEQGNEELAKQAMLTARSQMADAKSQMAKTLGNMDSKSAFAKMDKENSINAELEKLKQEMNNNN